MFDAAKLRFRQRLAGFYLHHVDQIFAAPHLMQTYPVEDALDMKSEHRLVKINRAADVGHLEHHMVDAVESGWNGAHRILAGCHTTIDAKYALSSTNCRRCSSGFLMQKLCSFAMGEPGQ